MPRSTTPTTEAGSLRTPLEIQSLQPTAPGRSGYAGNAWQQVGTAYGYIQPMGMVLRGPGAVPMVDALAMGDTLAKGLCRITLRYSPALAITVEQRLKAPDGRLFTIHSVQDMDERHRVLRLLCTIWTAQGAG